MGWSLGNRKYKAHEMNFLGIFLMGDSIKGARVNIDEHSSIEKCSDLISNECMTSIEKHLPKGRALKKIRLGEYGLSPLHLAAWNNRPDLCEYLIKKGIDPIINNLKTLLHIDLFWQKHQKKQRKLLK